jgi:hypothetical protein
LWQKLASSPMQTSRTKALTHEIAIGKPNPDSGFYGEKQSRYVRLRRHHIQPQELNPKHLSDISERLRDFGPIADGLLPAPFSLVR